MTIKIEANTIGTSTVQAQLTAPIRPTTQIRQTYDANLAGGEQRRKDGKDRPRVMLKIQLTGPTADVHAEAEFITALLEGNDPVTLESTTQALWRGKNRVALGINSIDEDIIDSDECMVYDITIQATIDGVWMADGGDFCFETGGSFRAFTDPPVQFVRDDGTVTGLTPLVEMPEQMPGYPLAINSTTRQYEEVPGPESITYEQTRDGTVRVLETYDFSNYLLRELPDEEDEGASHQFISCPSSAYLDGGDALLTNNLVKQDGTNIVKQDGTNIVARAGT